MPRKPLHARLHDDGDTLVLRSYAPSVPEGARLGRELSRHLAVAGYKPWRVEARKRGQGASAYVLVVYRRAGGGVVLSEDALAQIQADARAVLDEEGERCRGA